MVMVAILTTSDFDATMVDPLSVAFGPDGAPDIKGQGIIKDIDADGDYDLIVRFRVNQTGIQCGDTSATLTGETIDGIQIMGSDSIQTEGCAYDSE